MIKRIILCTALLFSLTVFPDAQTTTRCSNWTNLDGTGNLGGRKPAKPVFTVPGVRVKKCLTVNKTTGDVKQVCKFENTSGTAVKFMFCDMIELNSTFPTTTLTNSCNIKFDATTMKWKCEPGTGTSTGQPGLHFGCMAVDLAAAGDPGGGDKKTTTANSQSDDFKGKEAKDFEVSYADVFNLAIANTAGDCGFDATTCTGCFGANKSTNIGAGTDREDATGYWIMSDIPITDPFVIWQEITGFRYPMEYNPLASPLSVPSNFPANHPDLGRTTPNAIPAFQYQLDLLLWDIFTMSGGPNDSLPVEIQVFVDTLPPGVLIETNPFQTTIMGGTMDYGQIFVSQPGLGLVPEGSKVNFCIGVLHPQFLDSIMYWSQSGLAIQDTSPPIVLQSNVELLGNGMLTATIDARDATSFPVDANFFYSLDGGNTWETAPLNPAINPVESSPTNTFTDTFQIALLPGGNIDFFFNVQDGVLNQTWLGPGQEILDSRPEPSPVTFLNVLPNPAGASAVLHFRVDQDAYARLSLQDLQGRKVRNLFEGEVSGNELNEIQMDLSGLPAGVYFYSLSFTDGSTQAGKLIIME